jgi:hypothetical protein
VEINHLVPAEGVVDIQLQTRTHTSKKVNQTNTFANTAAINHFRQVGAIAGIALQTSMTISLLIKKTILVSFAAISHFLLLAATVEKVGMVFTNTFDHRSELKGINSVKISERVSLGNERIVSRRIFMLDISLG